MEPIGVMQITDTLSPGGLERVAVNLANSLAAADYRSHLCITRDGGPLESEISPEVMRCFLRRQGRFDLAALHRLVRYIGQHRIQILHAHGTSLFIAAAVSLMQSSVRFIWHDHYGRHETEKRNSLTYRMAVRSADGVICVTEPLAIWAREQLQVRPDRVWYLSNFARINEPDGTELKLPGERGARIVCVANFRPEKNHIGLIHAFRRVVRAHPQAHLLLVGAPNDAAYVRRVQESIGQSELTDNVTLMGSRASVADILRECDIGVLSSVSEGLPLALIEYGLAGLPVVATNVGQCAEVLDHGRVGILVPASSPEALSHALQLLLRSAKVRKEMACAFSRHVTKHYSADTALRRICDIYRIVLGNGAGERL